MGVSRTKTIKNKHATKNSGISNSKASKSGGPPDGIVKSKKKGPPPSSKPKGKGALAALLAKRKKKVYSEKELDIPKLNTVTPIGVEKPKGKKKGKVFVDDRESMNTILALVQADKEGEIESKMMKARQLEEIREARRVETEKKEAEKRARLDETKESLRRKRNRSIGKPSADAADDSVVKEAVTSGSRAVKPKKKRVSFA
ncbi:60S ribosomal subunit assembly/export protein LOC1 [Pestalotiopsis fici W106-1]|uniref:60S ribosomal subunit assembly/export protein LOC1 n=1 Tax=Pestalotiopsis fici (strain W106-1 / CGMCC3.15140) TaxID=1229662 RepID=W3WT08_PESFW|nr:60S ribosomal subunit assembly/export protein LOC1 [Pestalotiopsis fici W106-1]ETS76995.1 60S ribosomal subunit assembly/export protein LOC1 [Pestalotiopsis fici W106-1]